MSRWKAAAIHSSISIVVALAVGILLLGVWYPPPYFHAAGADQLILLLVGVDLVLGLLLTPQPAEILPTLRQREPVPHG